MIFDSKFIKNSAKLNGGGLYFINSDKIKITNSIFDENKVNFGSGSALWLSDSSLINTFIQLNTFQNNQALKGSGSIYWQYSSLSNKEPIGLRTNNKFYNNQAWNGKDIASSSKSITLSDSSITFNTFNRYLPPINVKLVDYYNQISPVQDIVITISTNSSMNKCGSNEVLNGQTSSSVVDELIWFNETNAVCDPGGNMLIWFNGELSGIFTSTLLNISFLECSSGEYSKSGRCVECTEGTYSLSYDGIKTKCHVGCPIGSVNCYKNILNLKSGWWREKKSTNLIYECPFGNVACEGGEQVADESCKIGYEGPLCAVCSTGYYFQSVDNTCQLCPKNQINLFSIILVILIGIIFIVIILYLLATNLDLISLMADFSIIAFLRYLYHKSFGERDYVKNSVQDEVIVNRISSKTKIYVTLFQILSSLPFVLHFSFPSYYSNIISFGSIMNLNFFNNLSLSCSYNYDYIDYLIMVTVIPVCLTILMIIMYWCHCFFLSIRFKSDSLFQILRNLSNIYLKIFLICSFLSLPGISIFIFRTFSCIDLDPNNKGGVYLQADYSISCNSSRYLWGRNYAIGMVFLYPIGVTGFYFWLLYRNRKTIKNRKSSSCSEEDLKSIEALEFLFNSYEPRYWYWEVVETTRRILLTGIMVLFHQGSSLQIVIAFVMSLLFTKLYGYYGE